MKEFLRKLILVSNDWTIQNPFMWSQILTNKKEDIEIQIIYGNDLSWDLLKMLVGYEGFSKIVIPSFHQKTLYKELTYKQALSCLYSNQIELLLFPILYFYNTQYDEVTMIESGLEDVLEWLDGHWIREENKK